MTRVGRKCEREILERQLAIRTEAAVTYAEVLRKIKSDPTHTELGTSVGRIRTATGDLHLEFGREANMTMKFKPQLETAGRANIKGLFHEVQVELKDLDETTSKEKIYEALKTRLGDENM